MNISEAKDILLTDFLAAIGCEPTGRTTNCDLNWKNLTHLEV